jgi:hypothetical protein
MPRGADNVQVSKLLGSKVQELLIGDDVIALIETCDADLTCSLLARAEILEGMGNVVTAVCNRCAPV